MKNHQITIKMNDEQIAALAREYAEEVYKDDESNPEVPVCLTRELKQQTAEYAEEIFRWLCRRFCLVEKSKATDLCRLTLEHGDSVDYGLIDGLTDLVLEVFPEQYQQVADNPEIGKEVENGLVGRDDKDLFHG